MRPSERDHRFVAYLECLAGDGPPGALHDLACGTMVPRDASGCGPPGRRPVAMLRSLRWLAPWTAHVSPQEQARHHLIAALFAGHPTDVHADAAGRASNLGHSMARVARLRGRTPSLEGRFVALLEADVEDVGEHLRRIVALARAAGVPLDWAQLLADLRRWDDPLRRVQAEWARGFWAAAPLG